MHTFALAFGAEAAGGVEEEERSLKEIDREAGNKGKESQQPEPEEKHPIAEEKKNFLIQRRV